MNRKKKISNIINILLVVIWMITVFNFSKDVGKESSNKSKLVTENIVKIVTSNKNITQEEKEEIIARIELIIRKCAHLLLYLIGGILIMNCVYQYNISENKKILSSFFIGLLYACSDELHQYFVPGRSAKVEDILIDMLGCVIGVLIYIGIIKALKSIYTYKKKYE